MRFSSDREQKYMYVADGGDEQVKILDRATGEILSTFGRPGHQLGEFTHAHTLAVESERNVYVAETDWGRRVQKFKPVK
jgi:DNA-binding beta-propeller fold protein YncE